MVVLNMRMMWCSCCAAIGQQQDVVLCTAGHCKAMHTSTKPAMLKPPVCLAVPSNAIYEVTIFNTEPWASGPGIRVFDILAEGTAVVQNLDLFLAGGGQFQAVNTTFTSPVVSPHYLRLNLLFKQQHCPCLATGQGATITALSR